ncbi:hypothetical protein HC723_12445 [Vibrio sp. S11_S32]|uniref:DUF2301 domain-containing membrane protein n=1 Tax=Vibrio sp. S11_S32 TaxID=2720225 RepID=UPI001680B4F6|nr:DUF2301 domain-containing membrane protein [Vibrio sp. S11_S32]MBD1577239.1 hypothetical protein [Vibrio sp. S11_S32]
MADIHVKEELDSIDYLTVGFYRLSFGVSAIAMLLFNFIAFEYASQLLICSSLVAAACMHIYDKNIRWIILGSALFSVCWLAIGIAPILAVGASFLVTSGLAIKEYYCFRIYLVRITPVVLIIYWLSLLIPILPIITHGLAIASFLLLSGICIAKFRQPFHFDIGDKSKFQE